ncbi:MAG: hypothetical protein ACREJ6_13690 [Candidatus Methylomirabilis sp.]
MAAKIKDVLRLNARVFLWAVTVNFLWEMSQAIAYTGMPPSAFEATLMCGQASIVDGILILGIYWAGVTIFSRHDWIKRTGLPGYFFMVGVGFLISVIIELSAVYRVGKWGYGTLMPMLPSLEVGILPVLQMIALPPLIFFLASRKSRRGDR